MSPTTPTRPATPVFGGMDQVELDRQYDQRTAVPNVPDYAERWAARSAERRAEGRHETLSYGPSPAEMIDVFPGHTGNPGVHMHIHGGAWRSMSRPEVCFVVEGLAPLGPPVAVAGFGLAPATRLPEIVDQIRRAFLFLRARFGPVTVSGHSSGAHLAACLLDRNWWAQAGLGREDFTAMLLASGPYDLEPVRLSARNAYLDLTEAEAAALSPARHLPDTLPSLAIIWGEGELPEFARQSRSMAEALRARRPDVHVEVLAGHNHFDVYETFGEAGGRPATLLAALAESATRSSQNREIRS